MCGVCGVYVCVWCGVCVCQLCVCGVWYVCECVCVLRCVLGCIAKFLTETHGQKSWKTPALCFSLESNDSKDEEHHHSLIKLQHTPQSLVQSFESEPEGAGASYALDVQTFSFERDSFKGGHCLFEKFKNVSWT